MSNETLAKVAAWSSNSANTGVSGGCGTEDPVKVSGGCGTQDPK